MSSDVQQYMLHSDQGRNIEPDIIKSLCKITSVKRSQTTSYHPKENGMVECSNQTLLRMLCSFTTEKNYWKSYISLLKCTITIVESMKVLVIRLFKLCLEGTQDYQLKKPEFA